MNGNKNGLFHTLIIAPTIDIDDRPAYNLHLDCCLLSQHDLSDGVCLHLIDVEC